MRRFSRTLKMAADAPIPNASVSTTTAVNPGALPKFRKAYRKSCRTEPIDPPYMPAAFASPIPDAKHEYSRYISGNSKRLRKSNAPLECQQYRRRLEGLSTLSSAPQSTHRLAAVRCKSESYRLPRILCSRSTASNSALMFPLPKPRAPWR